MLKVDKKMNQVHTRTSAYLIHCHRRWLITLGVTIVKKEVRLQPVITKLLERPSAGNVTQLWNATQQSVYYRLFFHFPQLGSWLLAWMIKASWQMAMHQTLPQSNSAVSLCVSLLICPHSPYWVTDIVVQMLKACVQERNTLECMIRVGYTFDTGGITQYFVSVKAQVCL